MKFKAAIMAALVGVTLYGCSPDGEVPPPGTKNTAPVISAFELDSSHVAAATPVTLTVTASDADAGDTLTYAFSKGNCEGTLSVEEGKAQDSNVATFTAGNTAGECQLKVTVADSHGATVEKTATLTVDSAENAAPVISAFELSDSRVPAATPVTLTVTASDADGDALTYAFSKGTCEGTLSVEEGLAQDANVVTFTTGNTEGACELNVTVEDAQGAKVEKTATLTVDSTKLEGFEVDTASWTGGETITSVESGAGTLALTAPEGTHYAEVQNKRDDYQPGYGDGGYSKFGGEGTEYKGDFYQAIDVYIDASWAPAAAAGVPSFWIDMAPHHENPDNYGAEHSFQLTATGTQVDVTADGKSDGLIASITTSGWYTFIMTFEKGAAGEPVVTRMVIRNAQGETVGTPVTVAGTSAGGPFMSEDLLGNGYVWIALWQNGFANDVVAIDNVKTGLLPF